jgi:hypothetical protein
MCNRFDQCGLSYARDSLDIYYSLLVNVPNDFVHLFGPSYEILNFGRIDAEHRCLSDICQGSRVELAENCALMLLFLVWIHHVDVGRVHSQEVAWVNIGLFFV